MEVYRYGNEPEAQKIKLLLEEQNIPCEVQSSENWGYDGMFRGQIGMGKIIVLDEFAVKAKEIIEKFTSEQKEELDEETKELKIMKLEHSITSSRNSVPFVYTVFTALSVPLLYRFRSIYTIAFIGIALVGVVRCASNLKKQVKNLEKELQDLKRQNNIEVN